ncbi:MAG: hypothetical protein Q9192_001044 [Flavoplaca navasiana]
MADPLSFVASIVAVSTLAGNIATKGYRYLKAVKDCPEDVRRLIAEVNVLCGILSRLTILLKGRKLGTGASKDPEFRKSNGLDDVSDQSAASDSSSEGDHAAGTSTDELEVPDFIHECRRTLDEIQVILNKFGHIDGSPTRDPTKTSRLSRLRSFEPKDLKWPLSSKKTMDLIQALERHKSTCTIALAQNGMIGIHAVLKETKLSNKYLAEIRANQETMVELQLTQAQGEFTSSHPCPSDLLRSLLAADERAFKRERQAGTGTWLLDLPEMINWLENPQDALWIYGIPGAGKTTLSTLVVDEILSRKRSNSVGTAYFYVRHDDKESHKPSSVLGSLISQLARHNREALSDLMNLYTQNQTHGLAAPDEEDLKEKLHDISQHFMEVYIMIDGLDECGPPYDAGRRRLVKAVAELHTIKEGSVRTLVFSRKESDIEKEFVHMQFNTVSIAATSGDLRLFANAWSGELDVHSEGLKAEIIDALVNEANGMFLWVRAQVDYLQRLPNDKEKRKALIRLPPDLPQTYIRIFETMDNIYPKQTTIYIKRLLTWLVFISRKDAYWDYPDFTIDTLREAISVEDDGYWPTMESIPTRDNICRWLGCLLRVDRKDRPILSHFTMKEFLSDDTELVSSSHAARQYMVGQEDERHLVNVCLNYAVHSHSSNTSFASRQDPIQVVSERPFYRYVVGWLPSHLSTIGNLDAELDHLIKLFLCMPPCPEFELWEICYARWIHVNEFSRGGKKPAEDEIDDEDVTHHLPTPLHFACFAGLKGQVEMLLEDGIHPDSTDGSKGSEILPIHLSIVSRTDQSPMSSLNFCMSLHNNDPDDNLKLGDKVVAAPEPYDVQIARLLVQSGADVNHQLLLTLVDVSPGIGDLNCVTTPLVLALALGKSTIACLLLDKDANWDAKASDARVDNESNGISEVCSVRRLLDLRWGLPEQEKVVRLAAKLSGCDGLMTMLEDWKLSQKQDGLVALSTGSPQDNDADLQTEFVNAFSSQNWQEVRELLTWHPDLDANGADENGESAVHLASKVEGDALSFLLEWGANPDLISSHGDTALCEASKNGFTENMKLLLRYGAKIEHQGRCGWTPLLVATNAGQIDAVQLLLDCGADISATSDTGEGAMHLALLKYDATVVDSLLTRGVKCFLPDNYGTTPLHLACELGLDTLVQRLLVLSTGVSESVNADSPVSGTPLYTTAREGHDSIIKQLLDCGAIIDKVGPGDILGSALMAACSEGRNEVVQTLLSRGAALEVEGSRFQSAEGTARASRQENILKILEEHEKNSKRVSGKGSIDGGISIMDSDDHEKYCAGETKQDSERGVDAGQQVEIPVTVSVQPASRELPTREQLLEDHIPKN